MSCLGVLFAVDAIITDHLKQLSAANRPNYITNELEEDYFTNHHLLVAELDKAWEGIHRMLTGGHFLFHTEKLLSSSQTYPLSHVILGGELLYGEEEGEDDYIISLKTPQQVADIWNVLRNYNAEDLQTLYWDIPASMGYSLSEDDCAYSISYLQSTFPFWEHAATHYLPVLFTVDQ